MCLVGVVAFLYGKFSVSTSPPQKLQETSGNVEELKSELGELEPELKATQEEGQRLTHALAQHRTQVSSVRDQMLAQEDKVKVKSSARLPFCLVILNFIHFFPISLTPNRKRLIQRGGIYFSVFHYVASFPFVRRGVTL